MFCRINSTLKHQANIRVKNENSFLYENFYKECLNHLFHFKHWHYIVLLTILIFFFLQIIDIDFLNIIDVKKEDVKQLIENRTTNIVTLISITFAVIGFLISNLAIKDGYIYSLLFKNSRFFSITYFVLSLIASFIILSTLKNHIPIEYVIRIFISGTYLILMGIFFIGYLFTRLILYTNDKYLHKIIRKDFFFESKKYLIIILREDYMKGILFNELGFGIYNNYHQNRLKGHTNPKLPSGTLVKDINIKKVKKILLKNKITSNNVYINVNYEDKFAINQNGFFFILINNQEINYQEVIKKLNKCIILEKMKVDLLPIEVILDYINQKVIEHTSKNNHKQVSEFTNMYFEYYDLQIKTKSYA
jgi:hypothetical protein